MRPEEPLESQWAAAGKFGCPLKACMQPLNLVTGPIELEVWGLVDDLEGGIQGHPRLSRVHGLATLEGKGRNQLRNFAFPISLFKRTELLQLAG